MKELISVRTASSGIECPCCHKAILDGEVLLCRVLLIGAHGSRAKCPRCRNWVNVPLVLTSAVPKSKATA